MNDVYLTYKDSATFYETVPDTYGNNKSIIQQATVSVIFVQATGYSRSNHQEAVTADCVCWPDPTDEFIISMKNRLEGLYVLMTLYDSTDEQSWYKVTGVSVNRDHLLTNQIDNIELQLKKTRPLPGVS